MWQRTPLKTNRKILVSVLSTQWDICFEHLHECMPFYLLLKLVQINVIFFYKAHMLHVYPDMIHVTTTEIQTLKITCWNKIFVEKDDKKTKKKNDANYKT